MAKRAKKRALTRPAPRSRGSMEPPFGRKLRFDLRALLEKARKLPIEVDGISLNLPFLSVTLKPKPIEKKIAREIVIRLSDKRVLNSRECCDSCVKAACESLQEIRKLLVDKQVEMAHKTDSGLYLLSELILEAIRQFLTLTEASDWRDPKREDIEALEALRAHIFRCLTQIALIADIQIPKISDGMRYDQVWDTEAYVAPKK